MPPRVDGVYWQVMFVAGVFGTVAGDLVSHTIGLYAACATLCPLLVAVLLIRQSVASRSVLLFWVIVMTERCAGTALGDSLASRHALGLGIWIASLCSVGLTVAIVAARARRR